jgi:hypothetical protein
MLGIDMSDAKSTKLNIREDRPTALSSSAHGSNVNAVGFNLLFIAKHEPKLAEEVLRLYAKAHTIQSSDPEAPDEDFALFADEVPKLLADKSDD